MHTTVNRGQPDALREKVIDTRNVGMHESVQEELLKNEHSRAKME